LEAPVEAFRPSAYTLTVEDGKVCPPSTLCSGVGAYQRSVDPAP